MELRHTVNLMLSDDYQERFVAEYLQLKIRADKLRKLIVDIEAGHADFEPSCSVEVLQEQLFAMERYMILLLARAHQEGIDLDRIAR